MARSKLIKKLSKKKIKSVSSKKVKAERKIGKVMEEYKEGDLMIGTSDKPVKSRKQAIAIALSEARKTGAKIPKKKKAERRKTKKRK